MTFILIAIAMLIVQYIGYRMWVAVDSAVTDYNARKVLSDTVRISGIHVAYRGNDRHGDSYRWFESAK